ncbi:type IV toxin-antitoxin system AbiEi family antitoxin domain-containing protein [Nocardioides sp.]|uniref:type IV toxin-antitoxin system AbiEi family antitoxin domain-containing protein n=1 Tax=Nocardioides sp. TaxID=35761 RepID=UPI003218F98C
MYARLAQVLASQGGLVTRTQALDRGLSPSRITQLLDTGALVWMVRGVYADGELHAGLDEFRGLPLLRVRATLLAKHHSWVLSHDSAALELGMPLIDPRVSLVHLTRPGFGAAWTRAGVAHHYGRFAAGELQTSETGYRHLSIARTAVDIAREHGELAGLVACDWSLRHGVERRALIEAYLPMSHWPGVIDVRAAVERADPRAESVAETLGRDLVEELGVGGVDVQFPLLLEGRPVWGDLRAGNHVFEVQGKVKYTPSGSGGVAERPITEVVWEEKKRSRLIRAEGLGLSEIIYQDFWGDRRAAALRRLRAEYDVSCDRFGADLHPRLAIQAAELRARFGRRDRAG